MTITSSVTLANEQCYSEAQLDQIAQAIVDLEKCRHQIREKEALIQERLQAYDGSPDIAWWQEPQWVGGGMVLSFALGLVMAYTAAKNE